MKELKYDKHDTPLFALTYGLYLVSARNGDKINGCIVNSVQQVTNTPEKLLIVINKHCYTHDMIKKSGTLCISVITKDAPYKLFSHFGFQSGKEVNKFDSWDYWLDKEKLPYLTKYLNAYISCKVIDLFDFGTHTAFMCEIKEMQKVNNIPSLLYKDYFEYIKPQGDYLSHEKYNEFVMMQGEPIMSIAMNSLKTVSKEESGMSTEDTIKTPDSDTLVIAVD